MRQLVNYKTSWASSGCAIRDFLFSRGQLAYAQESKSDIVIAPLKKVVLTSDLIVKYYWK